MPSDKDDDAPGRSTKLVHCEECGKEHELLSVRLELDLDIYQAMIFQQIVADLEDITMRMLVSKIARDNIPEYMIPTLIVSSSESGRDMANEIAIQIGSRLGILMHEVSEELKDE